MAEAVVLKALAIQTLLSTAEEAEALMEVSLVRLARLHGNRVAEKRVLLAAHQDLVDRVKVVFPAAQARKEWLL
jgi:hypothetical protein